MTTTSFYDLSADLDGLLRALDRRLSVPARPSVAAGGPRLPSTASGPGSETGRLEEKLAASMASCCRLLGVVRALRGFAGPAASIAPVPVPQANPVPVRNQLAVAPLSVPDRILKRNYNYFDSLNNDLADLAEKQQKSSTEDSLIAPY